MVSDLKGIKFLAKAVDLYAYGQRTEKNKKFSIAGDLCVYGQRAQRNLKFSKTSDLCVYGQRTEGNKNLAKPVTYVSRISKLKEIYKI